MALVGHRWADLLEAHEGLRGCWALGCGCGRNKRWMVGVFFCVGTDILQQGEVFGEVFVLLFV